MVNNNRLENQQPSQSAAQETYVDEVSLRLLARMIAKDILQGKHFFNTPDGSIESNNAPGKRPTEKRFGQQSEQNSGLVIKEGDLQC